MTAYRGGMRTSGRLPDGERNASSDRRLVLAPGTGIDEGPVDRWQRDVAVAAI